MANLLSMFDLTNPFNFNNLIAMNIIIEMEAILAIGTSRNLIVTSIQQAIQDSMSPSLIIKEVSEMVEDNHKEMRFLLGDNLIEKIKNFK